MSTKPDTDARQAATAFLSDKYGAQFIQSDPWIVDLLVEFTEHGTCTWTEDADGNWDTSCEKKYVIVEGTPSENGMEFCTFCGKVLTESATTSI